MKNWIPFILVTLIAIVIYGLSPILLPFVLGIAVAYFLDPLVKKLTSFKIPRSLASLVPVLIFFLTLIFASMAIVPAVVEDVLTFSSRLPQYLILLEETFHEEGELARYLAGYGLDLNALISYETLVNYSQEITVIAKEMVKSLAFSTLAIGEIFSLLIITPMVVYYLLNDWPHFEKHVKQLIPAKKRNSVVKTWNEMDAKLSKFLRGQMSVSLLLGLFYGIGLSLIGVSMGFVIGLAAGILSFIPYVGMLIGLVSACAVTCVQYQFGSADPYLMVFTVFAAGQLLEGFFLTPKFVGDNVGLHPVWVIFAVMAGGQLGGFLGVLLALPLASIATVLVPKLVTLWQNSMKGV